MKSVGIVIDVSPSVGMGHLYRCSVMAQHLCQQYDVHLYIAGQLSAGVKDIVTKVLNKLKWTNVALGMKSGSESPTAAYTEGLEHLPADRHEAWLVDISAASQLNFAQRYPEIVARALALDWFAPEHLPATTISLVDHDNIMSNAYVQAGYKDVEGARLLTGPEFAILKPGIVQLAQAQQIDAYSVGEFAQSTQGQAAQPGEANQHQAPDILLTFGGSDPSGCTNSAVQFLVPFLCAVGSVTVIMGALNSAAREELHNSLVSVPHEILHDPDDFDRRLAKADVVLCGGGGTLLEAMHLGRPCVVFAQNNAEKSHAAIYQRMGACAWPEQLDNLISSQRARLSMSTELQQLVDGHGVLRIASVLLEQHA